MSEFLPGGRHGSCIGYALITSGMVIWFVCSVLQILINRGVL